MGELELKGKVALVTGGARGIGKAIAEALAEAGAAVVAADLRRPGEEGFSGDAQGHAGRVAFRELDVRDYEQVKSVFKETAREFGGLHILVNNAGVTRDGLLGRMSLEDWREVLEVNLTGCFNCCRAAVRLMIPQREGRIINISSVVAAAGREGQANYAASKAGILGLTRSLALEVAHRGITVNAISPGFIETEMTGSLPEKVRKEILEQIPLGRAGRPEEVAALAVFLAGPGGAYITGQNFHINGGLFFG